MSVNRFVGFMKKIKTLNQHSQLSIFSKLVYLRKFCHITAEHLQQELPKQFSSERTATELQT